MLACVDVDYRGDEAVAACLVFAAPKDPREVARYVARHAPVAAYEPGRFFLRELPPLLAVLRLVEEPLETILVDGYAWLAPGRPGLGAHLYAALEHEVAVVGVAKRPFEGGEAVPVKRGKSAVPLWITAEGMPVEEAAALVARMHGGHRIPTLLKAVDRLSREA